MIFSTNLNKSPSKKKLEYFNRIFDPQKATLTTFRTKKAGMIPALNTF